MLYIFASTIGLGMAITMSILFLVLGLAAGWFISWKIFKKQIKNNPPVTDQQIRELYRQMGRKLSEKQLQQIMSSFKK